MTKYIAKPDTWFKAGTEVRLIDDYRKQSMPPRWEAGLFSGTRICKNPLSEGGRPLGSEYEDEEVCSFDEFEITEV